MVYKLVEYKDLGTGNGVGERNAGVNFNLVRATVGGSGLFTKANADGYMMTSTIQSVEVVDGKIHICTRNSLYVFEPITFTPPLAG